MFWIASAVWLAWAAWLGTLITREITDRWRVPYFTLFLVFALDAIAAAYLHTGTYANALGAFDFLIVAVLALIWLKQRKR